MPPIPPLRYSDKAEHMPDGTEIRRLEIDDNVERHLNARVAKLERDVAELRAALAQFDAQPIACSVCKDIERCRGNGRCWISGNVISSSPAASAGLIEAADMAVAAATKLQRNKLGSVYDDHAAAVYLDFARKLRSRAADRSGK